MLNNANNGVLTTRNVRSKPSQRRIFNNMVKRNQYYEDVEKMKYRLEKFVPNIQQVNQTDAKRVKTKRVYQRKVTQDLTESKDLNWRRKQELQHLRSGEHNGERDLIHLNRDPVKISSSPSISQSSLLYQNKKSRLSSITEENSLTRIIENPTSALGRSSLINRSQTSQNHIIPIQKRSPMNKINSSYQHDRWLRKYSFQQNIAKTSDDRFYLQQRAHLINQQKRLIEQKLKEFLH
ncbi:unnamed protein product [Rotaria sp. Silwood2]|nr:unnamed protein product [Rotaria sp. Silwood2]CAF2522275.1 unnamed protein product [Rotaria sp. Silwood2]CAF2782260.1 unnamed protein product [Rotaria sp. Silwood2]CAF2926380.1 unnamed protein product [Rotaria sp. Silwood2]CAF3924577.1 unnamed protein product [Rotaria sp. Silwood2]